GRTRGGAGGGSPTGGPPRAAREPRLRRPGPLREDVPPLLPEHVESGEPAPCEESDRPADATADRLTEPLAVREQIARARCLELEQAHERLVRPGAERPPCATPGAP